jgi:drug/metabolite transporter (DMT)-like permease
VRYALSSLLLTGLTLAVAAMLGEVCLSVLAVSPLRRLGALGVSVHATWLAAVLLGVTAVWFEGKQALAVPTPGEAMALAHMAINVTAVAFVFWYSAVDRLGPERAGLLLGCIPVAALLASAAVGSDQITAGKLVGVVVVAAGIVIGSSGLRMGTIPPVPIVDPADG